MTADEINAAHAATLDGFRLITSLVGGNMQVIWTLAGCLVIVGILALLIRGLYAAVGLRNLP